MSKIIKRLAVAGLAAAALGLSVATVAAEPTATATPTTATPAPAPSAPDYQVSAEQAYAVYLAAYGEGNGCRADFADAYHGVLRLSDLPKALRADLNDQHDSLKGDGPAMADYQDGTVMQLVDRPQIVIFIGQYEGACE